MANFFKAFVSKFRSIFGLTKSSKYVKDYLNEANMRSGIFMAAIIFILELGLLIRQADKYIIPNLGKLTSFSDGFELVFTNTSNFWLMLSMGLAMMFFCLQYVGKKKSKAKLIATIVSAAICFIFACLLPFEFIFGSVAFGKNTRSDIAAAYKIAYYVSVFLFDIAVAVSAIFRDRGGKWASTGAIVVISLFALVCMMFGIMVSYSDFTSSARFSYPDGDFQHKQIICFLTMVIYVGCLLIWKPYISIAVLGAIFLGFYFCLDAAAGYGSRRLPEGDVVNYFTFLISLIAIAISIYNQRLSEAVKDEKLELLATKDKLTDLYAFEYFLDLAAKRQEENPEVKDWIFLFINIKGFKIYNDQKGFEQGNVFLRDAAKIIQGSFADALASRPSDDHFVVMTRNENIREKVEEVNAQIEAYDKDIKPSINVGGYVLENGIGMAASVERARYVCSYLTKNDSVERYMEYDSKVHDEYILTQYVVRHIDEAIEKGYLQVYYQPVVWSNDRTLCGVEALARWIDPVYGFLSPSVFVPALESARLIHKLDVGMLRGVCGKLRYCLDNGLPALPTSINFSRADFGLIDVVKIIDDTVNEFGLSHDLIHVEITESALTDDEGVLHDAMNRLHKLGYALWLDDFGSGYSSFNVLKDYDFDVLKLDMKFLSGFDENKKARALISSVVAVAHDLNMMTLSEGVETKEEAEFLESVSCGRLQGYLYGKPISFDELMKKIENREYSLAKEIKTKNKPKSR
ncbi:MAG: EAL domain-containing protein [Bacilli bacterium]|nr:EAL domain-containing protein [Bacilli bacterium]